MLTAKNFITGALFLLNERNTCLFGMVVLKNLLCDAALIKNFLCIFVAQLKSYKYNHFDRYLKKNYLFFLFLLKGIPYPSLWLSLYLKTKECNLYFKLNPFNFVHLSSKFVRNWNLNFIFQ